MIVWLKDVCPKACYQKTVPQNKEQQETRVHWSMKVFCNGADIMTDPRGRIE